MLDICRQAICYGSEIEMPALVCWWSSWETESWMVHLIEIHQMALCKLFLSGVPIDIQQPARKGLYQIPMSHFHRTIVKAGTENGNISRSSTSKLKITYSDRYIQFVEAESSKLRDGGDSPAKFLPAHPSFFATSCLSRIPVSRIPNKLPPKLHRCEPGANNSTTELLWRLKTMGGKICRKVLNPTKS